MYGVTGAMDAGWSSVVLGVVYRWHTASHDVVVQCMLYVLVYDVSTVRPTCPSVIHVGIGRSFATIPSLSFCLSFSFFLYSSQWLSFVYDKVAVGSVSMRCSVSLFFSLGRHFLGCALPLTRRQQIYTQPMLSTSYRYRCYACPIVVVWFPTLVDCYHHLGE